MISFTHKDGVLYIIASGHVKAHDCGPIKDFATKHITEKDIITDVYLDMKECNYMDSTFIGVIAGINKQLRKKWKKSIQLQNTNKACMDLLDDMSLSPLLVFLSEAISFPTEATKVDDNILISKIDIAEAHEELTELSDDNKKKFGLLAKILRES